MRARAALTIGREITTAARYPAWMALTLMHAGTSLSPACCAKSYVSLQMDPSCDAAFPQ
jgi:hypothetical protein